MRLLYVTDLHGDEEKYKKSLQLAVEQGISLIVNGGDMLPKRGDRLAIQPPFIKGFLREYYRELQKRNIFYLAMLGNDDCLSVDSMFDSLCEEFQNVHNIAGKRVCINGYEFIGMNCILDHPFGCKDRVITESRYVPQEQRSPVVAISGQDGYTVIDDWSEYSRTQLPLMCDVLRELPKPDDPRKTVYIMHMPPAGLKLGQLNYPDRDIGSYDIYDFLKETQPLMSLHGHIHESPETASGRWMNNVRQTTCIQPGQTELHEDTMVCALLDLSANEFQRVVVRVK